jgi:molybdate transport system substrate-binding protein
MKTYLLCAVLLVSAPASWAQDLHILASRGVQAVMEELLSKDPAGKQAKVEYTTSTEIKAKIQAGEPFDLAVATTELIGELVKNGSVVPATRTSIARAGIGIGVRAGAPKPDVSNSDALKQALLKAKAVAYAKDGASRPHVEQMFDRMGIRQPMAAKSILEQGSVRSAERVADGSADFLLTLISEIKMAPGLEYVGPFPAEHQFYVAFAGAVGSKSRNRAAARKLLQSLTGPQVLSVLQRKGMEPLPN